MRIVRWRSLHPLVVASIVSVLITSLAGMARLVRLLPVTPSSGDAAVVPAAVRMASGTIAPNPQDGAEVSGDAGAGTTASGMPLAVPAVFIHVQDRALQQQMRMLGPVLAERGLRLAGVKVVERGPQRSDLRYFHEGERSEAVEVQKDLLALGLPVGQLKKIAGYEPIAIPRQYEVWLAADYRPAR